MYKKLNQNLMCFIKTLKCGMNKHVFYDFSWIKVDETCLSTVEITVTNRGITNFTAVGVDDAAGQDG